MPEALELWTSGVGVPGSTVAQARRAEEEGWDGMGVVDSQNLAADPYVEMGLAAAATDRLLLATAVTNPVTRHPAVAATAIATVQAESGGRAVLGIGRGDSSLAHLGMAPAPVPAFARYLERLQGYLRGEEVPFDVEADGRGEVRSSASLGLAGGPAASRLRWMRRAGVGKVPVDVAATGPRVIAAGARLADRVTFAVGADAERLSWAVAIARRAREEAGLDPAALPLGAYVPVLVHPDRSRARQLISGGVASFARFSVMHGTVAGPADEARRRTLEAVHDAYDMDHHFTDGSPQSQVLDDEVIDAFGVAGPAPYCVERLASLVELGLTKLFIMGGGIGMDRAEAADSRRALVEGVLPELRRLVTA
ncbi:MAG TPA: LLM class flavin-dependent oxidoreductase [Acidimicrobiales bacterium]|nr:LLM class flavin-dependent oxidoreductase [Acidimicrobiales bacterium]